MSIIARDRLLAIQRKMVMGPPSPAPIPPSSVFEKVAKEKT